MSDGVRVRVLFFAAAREAAGNISSIDLELPQSADTALLRTSLAGKYPDLAPLISNDEYITLALNEEYIAKGSNFSLKTGDTVALIPPISGG